jgi:hypothetical protein
MSPVQANLWKINFIFRCDAAPNSKLSFHAIIITPGCSWFSFNKTVLLKGAAHRNIDRKASVS